MNILSEPQNLILILIFSLASREVINILYEKGVRLKPYSPSDWAFIDVFNIEKAIKEGTLLYFMECDFIIFVKYLVLFKLVKF